MEIISNFKNLSPQKLGWIIILLLTLILATLLLCGTLSIFYVTNSNDRLLLIRLSELRKLTNELAVQNARYTCKAERPTYVPSLCTSENYGKSFKNMIPSTAYLRKSFTRLSSTLLYKHGNYCTHYSGFEPLFKSRSLYTLRWRKDMPYEFHDWLCQGVPVYFDCAFIHLSTRVEKADNLLWQ